MILLLAPAVFGQPPVSDSLKRAGALFEEALAFNDEGTARGFREAFDRFQMARRLYQEGGDQFGAARSLVGLGFTTDSLGDKPAALGFYQEALPVFRNLGEKLWEARTLNNIARLLDTTGEKKKALLYYSETLPLRKAVGDQYGESVTLNNIGAVYADLGEWQKALEFYFEALKLRRTTGNQGGEAVTLNNIGRIYDQLGEKSRALEYFNLSLPLRKAVGDRHGEATTLNNIGLVYADLTENSKALAFYNRSLGIARDLGDKNQEAVILGNIGTVYLAGGDYQKALANFRQALSIHIDAGDKSGQATTLNNIGLALAETSEPQQAREIFLTALPLLRAIGERKVEAITLNNLMLTWQSEKNLPLAVFYGKQSVNKYQELREAISGLDPKTQKTYLSTIEGTYRHLADLLIESGRFAQAEQVLEMLKEEEYFDFVRRDADEIRNLNKRVPLTETEQKLIRRYQELADRITAIGQEFLKLDEKRRGLLRIESQLSPADQTSFDRLSAELAEANAAFKLFLEKELLREIGRERISEIEFDRNLQSKLRKWGNGTVALTTVVAKDRYRVILTTPFVQVDGKTEIPAVELNKKVFAFREALQDLDTDPRALGKELYDILLKPIEKDLRAAGAKTLIWSLDGTLRYIPLSALSPDGRKYLVEQYQNVIITPKTRDDLTASTDEWKALGVGVSEAQSIENPDQAGKMIKFSPLPGTRDELLTIVKNENAPGESGIIPGRRYIDGDFTRKNLVDALMLETEQGKRKYTVVHIASHFRLGTNWSNSFLLLGNGQILTLEQIDNSPEISFGNVELVTLSACNTAFAGESNGKEVDSLAGAIQTKSGKAVMATLWAVVDESSPVLMSEFYRLRKENPALTKAEAIQRVQTGMITGRLKPSREYIDKLAGIFGVRGDKSISGNFVFETEKPFAHPYFWSPFVLIGNWR